MSWLARVFASGFARKLGYMAAVAVVGLLAQLLK